MPNIVFNKLEIHCNSQDFQSIVAVFQNSSKQKRLKVDIQGNIFNPEFNRDLNSIYFESWNDAPSDIIKRLSDIYKNTEMKLFSSSTVPGRFYSESTFINGHYAVFKHYCPCDIRIKVPPQLDYNDNIYETYMFIPEEFGINRTDLRSMAEFALHEAIFTSQNQKAAETYKVDSKQFKDALACAIESIIKCGPVYECISDNNNNQ